VNGYPDLPTINTSADADIRIGLDIDRFPAFALNLRDGCPIREPQAKLPEHHELKGSRP
jgi:hypothetical protein